MAPLLGFLLLAFLLLGSVLLLLALPALVLTLLLAVAGLLFPPLLGVALVLLPVSAGLFVLGVFLALLGALSLLSPAVRNLVATLVRLARVALRLLPSVEVIAQHLRLGASAVELARDALSKDGALSLDDAGQWIVDAGVLVPDIHTLDPTSKRLFQANPNDPDSGLLPWWTPPLPAPPLPYAEVVTGLQHATVPVGQTIQDVGAAVRDTAAGVSQRLDEAATAMRDIAQILEDSSQT